MKSKAYVKGKIISLLPLFLILLLAATCIETAILSYYPPRPLVMPVETALFDKASAVIGYETEESSYTAIEEKPQIVFVTEGVVIASVRVAFAEPMSANTTIRVFYAAAGQEFSEENSKSARIRQNAMEAVVGLPKGTYDAICFEIDGNFVLDRMEYSQNPPVRTHPSWQEAFALLAKLCIANLLLLLPICGYLIFSGRCLDGKKDKLIVSIYILIFLFFAFKMYYYYAFVRGFPDESRHVSYVGYLEMYKDFVPHFKDMGSLFSVGENVYQFEPNNTNYLGHPPFYYHILRLFGAVKVEGDFVYISQDLLHFGNAFISLAGILGVLYIGYTRIKQVPVLHLFYAMCATSVPMLAYLCAAINNDNLALLGVTIYLIGGIRFSEDKRGYATYFLVAAGIAIAMLAKLTAGMIAAFSACIYIGCVSMKRKNLSAVLCKEFLVTLPLYLAAVAYYVCIYLQVGSFQPALVKMNSAVFYESVFYVVPEARVSMTLLEHVKSFFGGFVQTWTSISSHNGLEKMYHFLDIRRIGLSALLVSPFLLIIKKMRHHRLSPFLLATFAAMLVVMAAQWLSGYSSFINYGRFGAYQSRYYLCAIAVTALSATIVAQSSYIDGKETKWVGRYNKLVSVACVLCSALLAFEDFIYFLLNFTNY